MKTSALLEVRAASQIDGFTADQIRRALWRWILANGERTITLRVWVIRKTFRVRDLHVVFALILGDCPPDLVRG